MNTINLAHGSGGLGTQQLLDHLFMCKFANPLLQAREDQARIPLAALAAQGQLLAFSTDSFVIDPLIFPGGDIGKLAICGTANDIAVSGAQAGFISCGFILEEGLSYSLLETIVDSMAGTAARAGIQIVTGDTKVVPRGAADKIFINTSGFGVIPQQVDWSMQHIQAGDQLLVSGTLGDHGATILNLREQLGLSVELQSDCALLSELIAPLRTMAGIKTMRDATRGGVNAVLHEFARSSQLGMEIQETALPVKAEVRGICELLGLEPVNFVNEGKLVIVVAPQAAGQVLDVLRQQPLGKDAAIIGEVVTTSGVRSTGAYGVRRTLDLPYYEALPRIC